MTTAKEPATAPLVDLVLYPNPPMGRFGHQVTLIATAAVGGALAVGFATIGAWPVSAFFGLDLLLLYGALHWTSRQARRMEIIRLESDRLVVRRVDAKGRAQEIDFEPYWVRVVLDESNRQMPRLSLRLHNSETPIGAFLNGAEKRELAAHLQRALARLRETS